MQPTGSLFTESPNKMCIFFFTIRPYPRKTSSRSTQEPAPNRKTQKQPQKESSPQISSLTPETLQAVPQSDNKVNTHTTYFPIPYNILINTNSDKQHLNQSDTPQEELKNNEIPQKKLSIKSWRTFSLHDLNKNSLGKPNPFINIIPTSINDPTTTQEINSLRGGNISQNSCKYNHQKTNGTRNTYSKVILFPQHSGGA